MVAGKTKGNSFWLCSRGAGEPAALSRTTRGMETTRAEHRRIW